MSVCLRLQKTLVSFENTMKTHLDKILYFLMIILTLSFHYILGVYLFIIHFTLFSQDVTKLVMCICLLMEKIFMKNLDSSYC